MKRAALLAIFLSALALTGCAGPLQTAQVKGQLFCRALAPQAPLIVAVADQAGLPISVIGMTADAVAKICDTLKARPVPPPAETVKTVTTP